MREEPSHLKTLQRGSITPFPLSSHPRRGDAARQAATSGTGATATRQAGCEAARGWLSAPVPHPRAEEHPQKQPQKAQRLPGAGQHVAS